MKNNKGLVVFALLLTGMFSMGYVYACGDKDPEQHCFRRDTLDAPVLTYQIGVASRDTIYQPEALQQFLVGLDSLMLGCDTVLTVVHLGDSHIQAGYFSGKVMRLLQEQFGNAGRGWIAPLKLSKTNEPDDYFLSSTVRDWISGRCIQNQRRCPIGPGGIGLQSAAASIDLSLSIAPKNGAGYAFNQVLFYRGDHSMPMIPQKNQKDSLSLSWDRDTVIPHLIVDTFRLATLADTLQIHSTRILPDEEKPRPLSSFRNLYYGMSLTNGQPGIFYHSIGVNGAMYVHYTDSAYIQQLKTFHPDLLIISLGTNETFGRRFDREEFANQVRTLLSLIRYYLPHTNLLLTTPPECFRRTYVNKQRKYIRNAQTEVVAATLLNVANEMGVACWDLFAATGGKGSCESWRKEQLFGRDRVHFTKDAYREQGVLLYRALRRLFFEKSSSDTSSYERVDQ